MQRVILPNRKVLRTVAQWSASIFVVLLLAWLGIPNIDRDQRQLRNQVSAYMDVQGLSAALTVFKRKHGGYPRQLEVLHETFLDVWVASRPDEGRDFAEIHWRTVQSRDLGYFYDYVPSHELAASNSSLSAHYEIRADPVVRGKTGFKSFYVSDTGTIRWSSERSAGPNDAEVK